MNALKLALFSAALAAISTEGLALELEANNQAPADDGPINIHSGNTDVVAATWSAGGPTEKHPVTNLLDDSDDAESKFVTPTNTAKTWVKVDFDQAR